IVNTLHKLKLMDKGFLRFASSQMDTVKKRRKVYYSWIVLRRLSIDIDKIVTISNENNIPFTIYVDTFDKIITFQKIKLFVENLKHVHLKLIETGHNSLLVKVAEDLKGTVS